MNLQIIVAACAASMVLAGCDKPKAPTAAKPDAQKVAAPAPLKAPESEVRAPAPPPPPGGGLPAPEIPPEVLAKIRADIEKNRLATPAAATPNNAPAQ